MGEEGSSVSALKGRIWTTAKTRMQSEKRYRLYSACSNVIISYYATFAVCISLFYDHINTDLPLSQINIAISLVILVASLLLYGFKFGETAQSHRDCYLRLQRLQDAPDAGHNLGEKYHEILAGYPNHSQGDYEDFVIRRTLVEGRLLTGPDEPIKWTYWMLARKVARFVTYWSIMGFLFIFPVLFTIFIWWAG